MTSASAHERIEHLLPTPQRLAVQLVDFVRIQLTNWRWAWRQHVVLGVVVPLTSMWLFRTVAGSMADDGRRAYIFVGGVLMAAAVQNQALVASNVAYMRANGMDIFFRSLPVNYSLLPLATFVSFAALSAPATLAALVVGPAIVDVDVSPTPPALLVLILTSAFVSYLGALVALSTRTPPAASALSFAASAALVGFGAVYFPSSELPGWAHRLVPLNPLFHAGRGMRLSLLDGWNEGSLVASTSALAAYALLTSAAVHCVVRFRSER